MLTRLAIAVLLGAVVGLEREQVHRGAGLKTHVLVSVGSALFTIVSLNGFFVPGRVNDPARVAAQIVSGIGFLGAGTIMKQGPTIRGLTTAASLWVVAGIGTAAGAGYYVAASATTLLVILSLTMFKLLERHLGKSTTLHLEVHVPRETAKIEEVHAVLQEMGLSYRNARMTVDNDTVKLRMHVETPHSRFDRASLMRRLLESGAHHVEW